MQSVWSSILAEVVRGSYKKLVFEDAMAETPSTSIVEAIKVLVQGLSNVNTIQDIQTVLGEDAPDLGVLLYDLERIKNSLAAENPFTETAHVAANDPQVNTAEKSVLAKLCQIVGDQLIAGTQLCDYLCETADRCITGDFCADRAQAILDLDMNVKILPVHQEIRELLSSLQMLRSLDKGPVEDGNIIEEMTTITKDYNLDTGYLYPRTTDPVMALVTLQASLINGTWDCKVVSVVSDNEDTEQTVAMAKKLFELDLKAASKDAGTFRQPIHWKIV